MVSFKRKKIEENSKTLAEILLQARKDQEINLLKVERATHVPKKYLEALEKGNYSVFPGQIYGRNFLRAYAKLLALDTNRLVNLFDQEYQTYYRFRTSQNQPRLDFKPRSKSSNFIIFPRLAQTITVIAVIALLMGYLGIKIKNIVTPPFLVVQAPIDNLILQDDNQIEIIGQTEKEARLTINKEEVLIDNSGAFHKTVSLKEGLNTIAIAANKKHSRENVIERHILVTKNRDKEITLSN
jgi:hypothetical protein